MISISVAWFQSDEGIRFKIKTDAEGYSADVALDLVNRSAELLKQAINEPTVVTPRVDGLEEYEVAEAEDDGTTDL